MQLMQKGMEVFKMMLVKNFWVIRTEKVLLNYSKVTRSDMIRYSRLEGTRQFSLDALEVNLK